MKFLYLNILICLALIASSCDNCDDNTQDIRVRKKIIKAQQDDEKKAKEAAQNEKQKKRETLERQLKDIEQEIEQIDKKLAEPIDQEVKQTKEYQESIIIAAEKRNMLEARKVGIQKKIKDEKRIGFPNLGNTCFANATMNVLFSSPSFIRFIETVSKHRTAKLSKDAYELIDAIKDLYESYKNGDSENIKSKLDTFYDAYEASALKEFGCKTVGGSGGGCLRSNQCDAQDLLRSLLALVHYPKLDGYMQDTSIDDKLKNPKKELTERGIALNFSEKDKETSLQNLLNDLTNNPELIDDFTFEDAPNEKQVALRKFILTEPAPNALFIDLKRYEQKFDLILNKWVEKKVSSVVIPDFELTIPFENKTDRDQKENHTYILTSIAVHRGGTSGGHYYAYVYESEDDEWFKYDDSYVSKVSKEKVIDDSKENGYIFSYTLKK